MTYKKIHHYNLRKHFSNLYEIYNSILSITLTFIFLIFKGLPRTDTGFLIFIEDKCFRTLITTILHRSATFIAIRNAL